MHFHGLCRDKEALLQRAAGCRVWVVGIWGCKGPILPCFPTFCGCACRRSRSRGDNVGMLGINGNCRTGLQAAGMESPYLFLIAHTWIKGALQSKL